MGLETRLSDSASVNRVILKEKLAEKLAEPWQIIISFKLGQFKRKLRLLILSNFRVGKWTTTAMFDRLGG